jgi:hypothetical protein
MKDRFFFIWMVYWTGPDEEEWIGPFSDVELARSHQAKYGPPDPALVVESDEHRVATMSPEEHITYMESRW